MKRIAYALICILLTGLPVYAQEMGLIQGLIVDAETGEPLIGANVMVKEPDGRPLYGTSTNLDGKFSFKAPVGTHDLEISYVSYATKIVTGVEVKPKVSTQVNISLTPEAIVGDEITVTARAEESSEVSMLAIQQRSSVVTDGISNELMSQAASSDAGDALKRVTGISVVGGRYVYVRGLGERYSNTQLNGSQIPSPEPSRRVVPMDIFPAGLLENIQVTKTFSPDQPGNFSGGSVKIQTRDFPDRLKFSVSASMGFNTQTTFRKIQTYPGGSSDFLGIDDGTREMPEIIRTGAADEPIITKGAFSTIGFSEEEVQAFGRSFKNIWSPQTRNGPVNQSYSISLGNSMNIGSRELGYLFSFNYGNSFSHRREIRNTFSAERDRLTKQNAFEFEKTSNEILWGTILNSSFRFSPLHKISIKTIYNRSTEDEASTYEGKNQDFDDLVKNSRLRYVERGIFSGNLSGEHHIGGFLNSNLLWQGWVSQATRNEPDNRQVLYLQGNDGEYRWRQKTQSGNRFFFNLVDNERGGKLDLAIPFVSPSDLPSRFKLGGIFSAKDRNFDVRRFVFKPGAQIRRDRDLLTLPAEELFTPENITPRRFFLEETTDPQDNYEATQNIRAGYGMVDVALLPRMRLVGGARFEASDQELTSFDPFAVDLSPVKINLNTRDVLPSLNLVLRLSDRANLRFAYSRTLTRPDFRELAPFEYLDFDGGVPEVGEPTLQRTRIDNFDARWERFPRLGELMAVSVFYKKFKDPIERIIEARANLLVSYVNALSARNYGVEIEFRRRFDIISPKLENFSINTNITLVRSKVTLPESVGVQTSTSRALQGQSPFVVNTMLGYNNPNIGTTASMLYNVFGKRISEVGGRRQPDVFEQPRHQIDFTLKQKLGSRYFLKLSAKNLLDSESLQKQGDQTFQRYKQGRSFSLGVSYER